MAVDNLSAINQFGSGLNLTQTIHVIFETEIALKNDKINEKLDPKTHEFSREIQ